MVEILNVKLPALMSPKSGDVDSKPGKLQEAGSMARAVGGTPNSNLDIWSILGDFLCARLVQAWSQ